MGRRLFAGDRFCRLPGAMGRKKQKMCGLAGCPAEKTGEILFVLTEIGRTECRGKRSLGLLEPQERMPLSLRGCDIII